MVSNDVNDLARSDTAGASGRTIFCTILSQNKKDAAAHISAQTQAADGIYVPDGGTSFSLTSFFFLFLTVFEVFKVLIWYAGANVFSF